MDTKPKIRLGNGKKRSESWLTAAICLSDCQAHSYTYNGKTYVNVNINIYDKPNDFGKDVAINLNDYKKEENLNAQVNNMPTAHSQSVITSKGESYQAEEYDLPF